MRQSIERALFFIHRWIGIILGSVIVLWFASGMVMMYVGYPKLTPAERLAHLPILRTPECCVSLEDAWRSVGSPSRPHAAVLTTIAGRPVYKFETGGRIHLVDAVTSALSKPVDLEQVVRAARAFLPGSEPVRSGLVREDMWTVWSALEAHRPLYWVEMNDSDRTRLYVSSVTGEVVQDANRAERRWNYAGAWLHWLLVFRSPVKADDHWHGVILGLSLTALVLTLSGLVAGVIRWRFRGTYGSGSRTPYRKKFMRWHHIIGLCFGIVTVTWVFSGLMSVNPWGLFSDTLPRRLEGAIVAGGLTGSTQHLLTALQPAMAARELEWPAAFNEPWVVARDGAGRTLIRTASGLTSQRLSVPSLVADVSSRFPGTHVKDVDELRAHDSYFYPRAMHTMRGHYDRRLPVVRITLDDPEETWLYVSPYTGAILEQIGPRQRAERWLFWFLHSWDSRRLLDARPLWDMVMLVLCVGGLGIGVTGVVIGVRRLRSKLSSTAFK